MTHDSRLPDLRAALQAAPADFEHPPHEVLVAWVDGRLDEADREWIESHVSVCVQCAEDAEDLRSVQRTLIPVRVASPWPRRLVVGGAIAAGVILTVWLVGRQPSTVTVDSVTATGRNLPPPASPATPASPTPPTPPTSPAEQMVEQALATGTLPLPPFHALVRSQAGTLLGDRGAAAGLQVTGPRGTAITATRPGFTWTAVTGAATYTISVFDEQFVEVASSGPVTTTSWTPDTDLPRGIVLSWQVTADLPSGRIVSPAPPQPEARFVILTAQQRRTIDEARRRLAGDPLALGLTLAEAGLYAEAEAALKRAAGDPRYDAAKVRKLLQALSYLPAAFL